MATKPGKLKQRDLTLSEVRDIEERTKRVTAERLAREAAAGEADASRAPAPPASNTGGKVPTEARRPDIAARLVLQDGEVLEIPARRGYGGAAAFIDWLNFTCHEDAFSVRRQGLTDDEVICEVSFWCERWFGFGITCQRDKGANFYERSYTLGDDYGLVCHGGQRGTVLVMLSGSGCAAAREGWEQRVRAFLEKEQTSRITRVDLAHDCYQGEHTVDDAAAWYDAGMFGCNGRMPDCEQRGNWKRPNGKGRSFYVGNRENGKYLRVYEKGMQLGDATSPWVRFEVELKSVNRLIPFEVLTEPGAYLAGAYPALHWVHDRQQRIATTAKTAQINYAAMVDWLKRQCGAALYVLSEIEGSAEAALAKVVRVGDIPKRVKVPDWRTCGEFLHQRARDVLPGELAIELSFA